MKNENASKNDTNHGTPIPPSGVPRKNNGKTAPEITIADSTYTTREIASEHNITAQTVRNYANTLADLGLITTIKGVGKHRYYCAYDAELIGKAIDLSAKNHLRKNEIIEVISSEALARRTPVNQFDELKEIMYAQHARNDKEINSIKSVCGNIHHDTSAILNTVTRSSASDNPRETAKIREEIISAIYNIKPAVEGIVCKIIKNIDKSLISIKQQIGKQRKASQILIKKIDKIDQKIEAQRKAAQTIEEISNDISRQLDAISSLMETKTKEFSYLIDSQSTTIINELLPENFETMSKELEEKTNALESANKMITKLSEENEELQNELIQKNNEIQKLNKIIYYRDEYC